MSESHPAVIRGMGAVLEWTALEDAGWSKGFFKNAMPEVKVHVSRAPTSRLHSEAHPLSAASNGDGSIVWHRPFAEGQYDRTTEKYSSPYLSSMLTRFETSTLHRIFG